MNDKAQVPVKNKIWEMINPFVFFIACMAACIFVIYLILGAVYEYSGVSGITLEEYVVQNSAIWCYLSFYAITIAVKYKSIAYDKFKYGHRSAHWKIEKCIAAAVIVFFAAYGISKIITISGLSNIFTTYSTSADSTFSGKPVALLIVITVILGPIAEEIIFRYMTFGRMRFYLGSKQAIIISSLLFGVYHANMVQFIYCTLLGVVLAIIYDRSGNLWITIAAHMAINFAGITAYF